MSNEDIDDYLLFPVINILIMEKMISSAGLYWKYTAGLIRNGLKLDELRIFESYLQFFEP